jgi:hypothetical protein
MTTSPSAPSSPSLQESGGITFRFVIPTAVRLVPPRRVQFSADDDDTNGKIMVTPDWLPNYQVTMIAPSNTTDNQRSRDIPRITVSTPSPTVKKHKSRFSPSPKGKRPPVNLKRRRDEPSSFDDNDDDDDDDGLEEERLPAPPRKKLRFKDIQMGNAKEEEKEEGLLGESSMGNIRIKIKQPGKVTRVSSGKKNNTNVRKVIKGPGGGLTIVFGLNQ